MDPSLDTTGSPTTTTTTDTSTQESTDSNGEWEDPTNDPDTAGSFYAPPEDDIGGVSACDPWMQDCPEGEKCVAYAENGGTWDANKCVPVQGSSATGDACTYGGLVEATDDCDAGNYCWNVNTDTSVGTCTAFCGGTADDPICDPGVECFIDGEGSLNLCLVACDPLAPDACLDGQACVWTNVEFQCLWLGDMPAAVGEACTLPNACEPGSMCVNADAFPECAGDGCCAEFCSTDDMMACGDPQLECVPFFEDPPPAGYETLGLCLAPPP